MPNYHFANVAGTASNRTVVALATLQAGASEPVAITTLVLAATRSLSEAAKFVLQRVASESGISTTVNGEKTTTRSPASVADVINAYTNLAGHPTLTGNPVIVFGGSISAAGNIGRFWNIYNPRYPLIVDQGTDYTINLAETFTTWSLGAWGWDEPALALPRSARPLRRRGRRRGYYPVYTTNIPGDISAVPNERNNFSNILWLQPRDWDLTFGVGSMALPSMPTSQAYTAALATTPTVQTTFTTKRTVPEPLSTTISAATLAARLTLLHGVTNTTPVPTTTIQTLRTIPETPSTLVSVQTAIARLLTTKPTILTVVNPTATLLAIRQIAEMITTSINTTTSVDRLLVSLRSILTQVNSTITTTVLRAVPELLTTLVSPVTSVATLRTTFVALMTSGIPETLVTAVRVTFVAITTSVTTTTTAAIQQFLVRAGSTEPTLSTLVTFQQVLLRSVQTVVSVLTTATGVLVTLRTGQTSGTATTAIDRRLNALRALVATPAPVTTVIFQQTLLRILTTLVTPATTAIRQLARSLFTAVPSSALADRRLNALRSDTTSPSSAVTSVATRSVPRDGQTSAMPQTPAPDLLTRAQRALVAITHPSTLVAMITSAITTATSPGYYVRGGQPRRRTIATRAPVARRAPVLPVQRRLAPLLIKTQLPTPAASVVRQLQVTALTFVQTVLQKARLTSSGAPSPLPIVQQGDDPEALIALGLSAADVQSDQKTDTDAFTTLDF